MSTAATPGTISVWVTRDYERLGIREVEVVAPHSLDMTVRLANGAGTYHWPHWHGTREAAEALAAELEEVNDLVLGPGWELYKVGGVARAYQTSTATDWTVRLWLSGTSRWTLFIRPRKKTPGVLTSTRRPLQEEALAILARPGEETVCYYKAELDERFGKKEGE